MELYEKTDENKTDEKPNLLAVAAGITLGVITAVVVEALFVWAILFYIVGASFTFPQVFGVMLIINGITSKFKSFS